jgi:hypothetical protein
MIIAERGECNMIKQMQTGSVSVMRKEKSCSFFRKLAQSYIKGVMHAQYANSVTQTFGHYMDNK